MDKVKDFYVSCDGIDILCDNIELRLGVEGLTDSIVLRVDRRIVARFPISAYDLVYDFDAVGTFYFCLVRKPLILELLDYDTRYRCYTAASCRAVGLPMFDFGEYSKYANKWLSKTRCDRIKRPVVSYENPVAFLRVMHGYVPLYDRSGLNEKD